MFHVLTGTGAGATRPGSRSCKASGKKGMTSGPSATMTRMDLDTGPFEGMRKMFAAGTGNNRAEEAERILRAPPKTIRGI